MVSLGIKIYIILMPNIEHRAIYKLGKQSLCPQLPYIGIKFIALISLSKS